MSAQGRPKREYRSAQHAGSSVSVRVRLFQRLLGLLINVGGLAVLVDLAASKVLR
jgi:hypothetical protein